MHSWRSSFHTSVRSTLLMLGFFLFAIAYICLPQTAFAQARLAASDPADGASVRPGISTITITFTEQISVDQSSAQLFVEGQLSQASVTTQVEREDQKVLRVTTSPLEEGRYMLKWHAATEKDGGLTDGQITFTVGNPPPAAQSTSTPQPTAPPAAPQTNPTDAPATSLSPNNALNWLLLGVTVILLALVTWQAVAWSRRRSGRDAGKS